ncbi:hypothetical protein VTO42DRAFT_1560 [Malbranchea cinnamomea]
MRGRSFLLEACKASYVCSSCARQTLWSGGVQSVGSSAVRELPARVESTATQSSTARQFSTASRKLHSVVPNASVSTATHLANAAQSGTNNRLADNDDSLGPAQRRHVMREKELLALIEEGQPGRVMAAFMDPMNRKILHSLPPATFAEVLRLLSPAYFIEPYKVILERLYNVRAGAKRMRHIRSIFAQFSENLRQIVSGRRHAGYKLGIAEYTHLLDCAKSMGAAELADNLWQDMLADSVEPTLECYNYYMESKTWHDAYYQKQNHRLRSNPWNYKHRWYWKRGRGFTGYRTGEGGVQDEVYDLFNKLVQSGLDPDTATYIQLMTASARNWDMDNVKSILKKIWNVDVDILVQDPNEHPPVTQYAPSSPLYPTADLLYALAHIFCSNNDFTTALQVVDFFSLRYGLPIPEKAWKELLIWSFVLSKKRHAFGSPGHMIGRIPNSSVMEVFATMVAEPYNVTPSLRAYDILAKLKWTRQTLDQMVSEMRAGRNLLFEILSKRENAKKFFESLATRVVKERLELANTSPPGRPPAQLVDLGPYQHLIPTSAFDDGLHWHAFHEFQIQQMAAIRGSVYIERWVKLLLSRRKWSGDRYWYERRRIPDIISEWKEFLPSPLFYQTTGGQVEFEMKTLWPEGERTNPAHLTPLRLYERGNFRVGELIVSNTRDIPLASRLWAAMREESWLDKVRSIRLKQPDWGRGRWDLKRRHTAPQEDKLSRQFRRRTSRTTV